MEIPLQIELGIQIDPSLVDRQIHIQVSLLLWIQEKQAVKVDWNV